MRLELSRQAEADLEDIRDYSIDQFGIERTIGYLDGLEAAFRRILSYPEVGALRPDLRPGVRALGCQQHRIFYAMEGERIRVVRVLHKRMDEERRL